MMTTINPLSSITAVFLLFLSAVSFIIVVAFGVWGLGSLAQVSGRQFEIQGDSQLGFRIRTSLHPHYPKHRQATTNTMARRTVSRGGAQTHRASRTMKSGISFPPKTKTAWLTMVVAVGCCCLCFHPSSTASWLMVSAEPMTATAASSHTASSTSSQQQNNNVLGGSGGGSGSGSEKDSAKDAMINSLVLEVTELNSRNFDSFVSDGNVWLVEFYTPW
jgi:hypothetical protein